MRKRGIKQGRHENTYHVNDVRWTQGECKVVAVSEFLTSQAEWLRFCEHQGPCQVMEYDEVHYII